MAITQVSETDGSDGQDRDGIEEKRFVGTLSLNVYPPRAPLATLQPQTLSAS